MTIEELRAKAHKAWKAYRKEPDKKRKAEFCDAFKEARAEFLAAKERFKTVNGRRFVMKNFIEDYLPIAIAGGVLGFIVGVATFVWTYFVTL